MQCCHDAAVSKHKKKKCFRQVCQVRCSWGRHERFTAVVIDSLVILSAFMPNGGYDEENYIAELEIVKIIMEERNRWVPLAVTSTSSSNWRVEK